MFVKLNQHGQYLSTAYMPIRKDTLFCKQQEKHEIQINIYQLSATIANIKDTHPAKGL